MHYSWHLAPHLKAIYRYHSSHFHWPLHALPNENILLRPRMPGVLSNVLGYFSLFISVDFSECRANVSEHQGGIIFQVNILNGEKTYSKAYIIVIMDITSMTLHLSTLVSPLARRALNPPTPLISRHV